ADRYYLYLYVNELRLTRNAYPAPREYAFPDLVSDPLNDNWRVVEKQPTSINVYPNNIQLIHRATTPQVNGERVSIRFYVPQTGPYDLSLRHANDFAGGVVAILVDNHTVAADFSFHSPTTHHNVQAGLATNLYLTQGYHELQFEAKQSVLYETADRYYL